MRIGVVGGGVTGNATARSYLEHAEQVRVYDVDSTRKTHDLYEVLECDLVFLCLPETVLDSFVPGFHCDAHLVLKSTVPIGTTKKLQKRFPKIIHSPEFLTARCAVEDAQMPARNIIGSPGIGSEETSSLLEGLYWKRFPGIPIHCMSSDESEAVKLIQNGFFACKVAFFNEVYKGLNFDLAGVTSWNRVLRAVITDGRIGHSHTRVPGPDGKMGFGGTCLPKDLLMLIQALGNEAEVTQAAMERNARDRE